jgi:hypothetical protein
MTTETMREAVARAIAKGLGDEFDNAFVSKVGWTAAQGQRGGRFRDINEPFQADYLDAADAAIRTVLERLREPTSAAIQAGVEAYWPLSEFVEGPLTNGERARRGYLAMLDAAITPPLPESAGSGRG